VISGLTIALAASRVRVGIAKPVEACRGYKYSFELTLNDKVRWRMEDKLRTSVRILAVAWIGL
jgi:hypothetical protein